MNVIIERQSPDWGSPHFDADKAATLLANRLYGPSVEGFKYAAYTRELHALWESCFSTSLALCRNFLKELAHENWRQVKNCHAIFSEPQHRVVSETIFGGSGWILFTDDDDWFSPEIFARIEDISQNPSNCVIWNRVRFDGHMTITPITPTAKSPLFAYTNNYAVRADTFSAGSQVASVMQHGFANGMIQDKQWRVFFARAPLFP